LIGNMSLVGPRPYLPREKEQMSYFFDTIVEIRPGITGLWQVSGRNDVDFQGRLELDAWYVRNWSFWMDVTMLLKTVKVVFGKFGAY
jgi:lipopolysaccharide/colanic/teichoic acid biosynthesis glycosyltransferase